MRQYTLHFGYSKSRRYAQAVAMAEMCSGHEVSGKGHNIWHRVTVTDDQIDLLASLHGLARGFFYPRIHDAPAWSVWSFLKNGHYDYVYDTPGQRRRVREAGERLIAAKGGNVAAAVQALKGEILDLIAADLKAVTDALLAHGYLVADPLTAPEAPPARRPQEHHPAYAPVRLAIDEGRLADAIALYYDGLGDKPFDELHPELLYLKRLATIPLLGRDILAFRNASTWTDLIRTHVHEYCACIEEAAKMAVKVGRESALDVLTSGVPTFDELIARTERKYHRQAYVWDEPYDRVKLDRTVVTPEHFGRFTCPVGRLFDRYVNPLVYHWSEDEAQEYAFEKGVWTPVSPAFVEREILAKDLVLAGVPAWKPTRRQPSIEAFSEPTHVAYSKFGVSGIRYTGRVHRLAGTALYEADLLRNDIPGASLGSSLQDWAAEILREAENLLRERHGLPRIGEGWVSETLLYTLVRELFPDAIQHASPLWLQPQHLDIFVPSRRFAIEYQGAQHFEAIDFFGGEAALMTTAERDKRKRRKCRARGVKLLYWHHTDAITREALRSKLGPGECIL